MFNIDASKFPPIFTEFINMLNNYVNFEARTTVKGFWMAFLWVFIVTLVPVLGWIAWLFLIVPTIAMMVRRLRDAGKEWYWLLVPIAGIIFLCQPSVPDDGTPVV